jgi:hypothetical protein
LQQQGRHATINLERLAVLRSRQRAGRAARGDELVAPASLRLPASKSDAPAREPRPKQEDDASKTGATNGCMTLGSQILTLFVLALPVACVAWTVTHEEIFREPREWCAVRSRSGRRLVPRKFFYIPTCEYCFSHYVAAAMLVITRFTLVYDGWRGYLIAWFSLVWIANLYMSLFAHVRLEIREERLDIAAAESAHATDRHE